MTVSRAVEDAVRNHDAEAIGACYTDDAIVMPPDAPFVKGRSAISQFWDAAFQQMGLRGLELRTLDLEVTGDAASEVGEAVLALASASVTVKYVVVWKRAGGGWRLHRDIWNMKAG